MKVICYGDSNTYGYDPRSYLGDRYTPKNRWVDIVADKTGWQVENRGLNGRRIPMGEAALPQDTDLVILMLGTNDLLAGMSHEAVTEKMERFIGSIHLPHDKILLIAPPPMESGTWVDDPEIIRNSQKLGKDYETLARRTGVMFVDGGAWNIVLAFDGVHFTEAGHRIFGEQLCRFLKNQKGRNGMEPDLWKVTFDGSFWKAKRDAGREIPVKKNFSWEGEFWYIPAVYLCREGLVMDLCKRADPEDITDYIQRWDLIHEQEHSYSRQEQEQMERAHPLRTDILPKVTVNGKMLKNDHGCGISWIPSQCLQGMEAKEAEAERVLDHYGLDPLRGWTICRHSFSWAFGPVEEIETLHLSMECTPVFVPAASIENPQDGQVILLLHPTTGHVYSLTIRGRDIKKLDENILKDEDERTFNKEVGAVPAAINYPTYYEMLSYMVEPEVDGGELIIRDMEDGDRPVIRSAGQDGASPSAASAAVIGGADGPTSVFISAGKKKSDVHISCSSLYFQPPEMVRWMAGFMIREKDRIEISVIGRKVQEI